MSDTREVFTILLVNAVMLAVLVTPGGAEPEPSGGQGPNPASSTETVGEPFQISPDTGTCDRHDPAVAYDSAHGEYLVVWQNTWPGGVRDIYARRVSTRR